MIYLSIVKRAENHPTTGRAQYRVVETEAADEKILDANGIYKKAFFLRKTKELVIRTNKPYRVGNLINPRKAIGI